MQITKEWLASSILLNEQGSYLLSQKQTEYLIRWFPELFVDISKKQFIKHWNDILCTKEITEHQAGLFLSAKMDESKTPQKISTHLKRLVLAGTEFCKSTTGKEPGYPQLRLISLIGHIPEVDVISIKFTPADMNSLTIVEFIFEDSENYKHLECICGGEPFLKEGKKVVWTILNAIIQPTIAGEEAEHKELKDCTGLSIVDCINELRKKKKLIIKRKTSVILEASNPNDELHKTAKQKKKEYKQNVKIAKKNGLTIQPMSNFDKLRDMFIDDFNNVNKKRKQNGLNEITLQEFAAAAKINLQDASDLLNYKSGKIDWKNI